MDCLCNNSVIFTSRSDCSLNLPYSYNLRHRDYNLNLVYQLHMWILKVCRALLTVIVKSLKYRDVIKMNHTVT